MKKIIFIDFATTSLLLSSTQAFALFSVSVGVPLNHSFGSDTETDSVSGTLIGVELPFALGLGMDSYKTKVKDSVLELETSVYNIFYQLPVPIVNLILGVGTGNHEFVCSDIGDGSSCSDYFEKGSITQWYTSIGMPIIPFFDIHLSYRSITSKNVEVIKGTSKGSKSDLNSTITGVGIAFNF